MATDLADSDIKEQGIAFFFTGAHVVMLYHCFFLYVVEYMYVGRSLLCLNFIFSFLFLFPLESSVDPTFLDRLQELFPTYSKPTSYPT